MRIGILRPLQASNVAIALLWVVTLLAALYRYYWLDAKDRYKCGAVLTQGQWAEAPRSASQTTDTFERWQSTGCLFHQYTSEDIRTCLTGQRIVYIGDSVIRQVFWATARKLHPAAADELTREVEKHSDIELSRFNITIQFIWDPFLNSTGLHRELAGHSIPAQNNANHINGTAGLVVIGGGLWHARHLGTKSLDSYTTRVDSIVSLITAREVEKRSIHSAFNTIPERSTKDIYMIPVTIPLYDILSPSRAATITPTKINAMNKYLHQKALHNGIKVAWSHSLMTWQSDSAYEESGLHVLTSVARSKADVLLNVRSLQNFMDI
ncbi:MAG: hypothetical protein LQ351_003491 [Letrouitia transgressa]|nr:MAG: hypothetical protein LQ351_003491 [Letrouitia transgressa]